MLYKQMINRTHQDNRNLESKIQQFNHESQMPLVSPEEQERLMRERQELERLENQLRSTHVDRFKEYQEIQWAPGQNQGYQNQQQGFGGGLGQGGDMIPPAMKRPYQENEVEATYQNYQQFNPNVYIFLFLQFFLDLVRLNKIKFKQNNFFANFLIW